MTWEFKMAQAPNLFAIKHGGGVKFYVKGNGLIILEFPFVRRWVFALSEVIPLALGIQVSSPKC